MDIDLNRNYMLLLVALKVFKNQFIMENKQQIIYIKSP